MDMLLEKQKGIQQLIADARAASNNDTKSSMGDKYETTREMMQIEINKLQLQLQECGQMLLALKVIDPEKRSEIAESGALVFTDKINFFIATGIGRVQVENQSWMVVSSSSPIGKSMQGKKVGDLLTTQAFHAKILQIS
ncbi:MAG: hypothetical protein KG003_15505 [Bacteroidetes bacterium]|nr:hypothetical protein [Bacteroidota bacterium]